jgi:hypothetical protein
MCDMFATRAYCFCVNMAVKYICEFVLCTVHIVFSDVRAHVLHAHAFQDYSVRCCMTSSDRKKRLNIFAVKPKPTVRSKDILIICNRRWFSELYSHCDDEKTSGQAPTRFLRTLSKVQV